MYLVMHGEVRVLIVRSGWATMRTSGRKSGSRIIDRCG